MTAEHGTTSRYQNQKCRCDKCRTAQREAHRAWRERSRNYPADQIPHGDGGYRNYGCRCQTCRVDHSDIQAVKRAEYRARKTGAGNR